ncbi:hypothetical protein PCL_12587 [Purpureocillium lilacinum]|uniref:Uncharacterized protein n=1 Tax=Purpureocillium lilacinum TaxID=33203 RepID=A0A2U3E9N9_PURLI|nr:hypothetical protein PCL_12587 [Purpureocillium lilacinum]
MRMRTRLTTRKHFETCAARDVVRTYMHAQAHRHIPRTYVDSLCARPDTQTDTYAYTDTTRLRPGPWSKGTNTLSRVDAVQRATRRLASARASDAVTPDLDFARETCARVCPSGVGTVHSLTVARSVRRTKQTGRRNGCFLVRRGPSQPWTQYYTPAWHHHHQQHHTPARSILHLPCAMSPYGDCPPPRHELICPRDLTEIRDAHDDTEARQSSSHRPLLSPGAFRTCSNGGDRSGSDVSVFVPVAMLTPARPRMLTGYQVQRTHSKSPQTTQDNLLTPYSNQCDPVRDGGKQHTPPFCSLSLHATPGSDVSIGPASLLHRTNMQLTWDKWPPTQCRTVRRRGWGSGSSRRRIRLSRGYSHPVWTGRPATLVFAFSVWAFPAAQALRRLATKRWPCSPGEI